MTNCMKLPVSNTGITTVVYCNFTFSNYRDAMEKAPYTYGLLEMVVTVMTRVQLMAIHPVSTPSLSALLTRTQKRPSMMRSVRQR